MYSYMIHKEDKTLEQLTETQEMLASFDKETIQRLLKMALNDKMREDEKRERENKKSPFRDFYQVNKEHTDDLMWLLNENPNSYKILLFLFDHMDKYNAVMCSYQVLQEALTISRATASRAIKLLKDHGFIHVYKSGTSNVYVTNPDLVWNSWGNNRQYCEFPANIVLSASEQEERSKVRDKRVQTVQVKE
jgi:DNA-binding transcriptional ArsR family regulator